MFNYRCRIPVEQVRKDKKQEFFYHEGTKVHEVLKRFDYFILSSFVVLRVFVVNTNYSYVGTFK